MNGNNSLRTLAGVLGASALLMAASGPAHAVVADDVVCSGCVDSTDIAFKTVKNSNIGNRAVGSKKLAADLSIGFDDNAGSLIIRDDLAATKVIFEAGVLGNTVAVGRGGVAATERVDADLVVYDPFFADTVDEREEAFWLNASISDFTLGSGNSTTAGDNGDIFIQNGSGAVSISLNGSSASAILGVSGQAGEVFIRDPGGATEISLDGDTGDVINQLPGNGLVKAWARIDDAGNIVSCFRCNAAETGKVLSFYEVDFTPLGTDISARPRLAVVDTHAAVFVGTAEVELANRAADPSSVAVRFVDNTGATVDRDFTLVIF